jgi:hypothetical protein
MLRRGSLSASKQRKEYGKAGDGERFLDKPAHESSEQNGEIWKGMTLKSMYGADANCAGHAQAESEHLMLGAFTFQCSEW